MRFQLVDRILEVEAGSRLKAVKNLARGEEYLADHFPSFPVMPGVLMLHSLVESASWLWRITDEFEYSTIVLREVRSVKYGHFMVPGFQLGIEVELQKQDGDLATFRGTGVSQEQTCVSSRFTLERYNLEQRVPALAGNDDRLREHWKQRYTWLIQLNDSGMKQRDHE